MNNSETKRQTNIDLLRFLAIASVIYLHYYNPTIGGGIAFVEKDSLNEVLLRVTHAFSICAVDVFVITSGYFLCNSNCRYMGRAIILIFQIVFYNLFFYFWGMLHGDYVFCLREFLLAALPCNWFMICYIVLYIVSPLINQSFCILPQRRDGCRLSKMNVILILFFLFCVWPTMVDIMFQVSGNEMLGLSTVGLYGSGRGYTIINFFFCYILGAWIRSSDDKTIRTRILLVILGGCVLIIYIWNCINPYTSNEYCNPVIIIEATVIFVLFLRIRIRNNTISKYLSIISEGSLTVYLTHGYFIRMINIESYVRSSPVKLLIHIIITVICLILIGLLFDQIYKMIMRIPNKYLKTKWQYTI